MILLVIASSGSLKIFQNSRTSGDSLSWKKDRSQRTVGFGYFENVKELLVCLKGLVVLWAGNLISLTTTDSSSLNIMESENRQLLIWKKIRIKEPLVSVISKTSKTLRFGWKVRLLSG
jgi:hypothetical protein